MLGCDLPTWKWEWCGHSAEMAPRSGPCRRGGALRVIPNRLVSQGTKGQPSWTAPHVPVVSNVSVWLTCLSKQCHQKSSMHRTERIETAMGTGPFLSA